MKHIHLLYDTMIIKGILYNENRNCIYKTEVNEFMCQYDIHIMVYVSLFEVALYHI